MSLIQLCEDSAGQQVNISEIFLRKEENSVWFGGKHVITVVSIIYNFLTHIQQSSTFKTTHFKDQSTIKTTWDWFQTANFNVVQSR